MEQLQGIEAGNMESINSTDNGYVSLDHVEQGASGIYAQLSPEFSRKLSFVEHDDDEKYIVVPGNPSRLKCSEVTTLPAVGDYRDTCEKMSSNPVLVVEDKADIGEEASTIHNVSDVTTSENKQPFICVCGKRFEKSVQLATHTRWSCELKEKKAQCDVCKNWFASDMGLKRHLKHAHGGVYSCESCSLRFPNKVKLTRHWLEVHYDENKEQFKMLKCFECSDTNFDSKFELECHLVLHKFEKHQKKLAFGTSSPHPDIPFSPYTSPPFLRAMRPPHPFHHPYGFGHPWSHFPFRPPGPMFPFMPCSSYGQMRPPFPPHPRHCQFSAAANQYTSGHGDASSVASSSRPSTFYGSSKKADDISTSSVKSKDVPHHNHEYMEPTAFPYFFHTPYDYTHHKHHHHKHHDHHGKRKWKKYFKLMMKGEVPPLIPGLVPKQELKKPGQIQNIQEKNKNLENSADACEFKMACKFCDKVIEKNNVLWHQKKECPVLATHQCSVCERVFKKRHFLIRHIHEQNHFHPVGSSVSQTGQSSANFSSLSSLREQMNTSLKLNNFSEDVLRVSEAGDLRVTQMHAPVERNVLHVPVERNVLHVPVERNALEDNCTEATQLTREIKICDANIGQENIMVERPLLQSYDAESVKQLQCATCKCVCRSVENLSEHLNGHISQVLAVQKVREWTSKSSEYFFIAHDDDEDDEEGSASTTTSYFDSEITSTSSSAVQDIGSTLSSLETTESKDAKWTKPHKRRRHHKGEVTICEFCGEKFAFRKDLHYHMETSHKDSTLECPVCRKKFSWKKRGKFYERHLNSHYGVKIFKHKCEACGKTFLENSKLRAHMSLHNSELLHKCSVCGRGYANKSSLVRHERKHTGVKPYQCEICSESFMEKRELLRHSTTHTGLAPFNCSECGQGFTLKTSLVSHMKKKHLKKEKSLRS